MTIRTLQQLRSHIPPSGPNEQWLQGMVAQGSLSVDDIPEWLAKPIRSPGKEMRHLLRALVQFTPTLDEDRLAQLLSDDPLLAYRVLKNEQLDSSLKEQAWNAGQQMLERRLEAGRKGDADGIGKSANQLNLLHLQAPVMVGRPIVPVDHVRELLERAGRNQEALRAGWSWQDRRWMTAAIVHSPWQPSPEELTRTAESLAECYPVILLAVERAATKEHWRRILERFPEAPDSFMENVMSGRTEPGLPPQGLSGEAGEHLFDILSKRTEKGSVAQYDIVETIMAMGNQHPEIDRGKVLDYFPGVDHADLFEWLVVDRDQGSEAFRGLRLDQIRGALAHKDTEVRSAAFDALEGAVADSPPEKGRHAERTVRP